MWHLRGQKLESMNGQPPAETRRLQEEPNEKVFELLIYEGSHAYQMGANARGRALSLFCALLVFSRDPILKREGLFGQVLFQGMVGIKV